LVSPKSLSGWGPLYIEFWDLCSEVRRQEVLRPHLQSASQGVQRINAGPHFRIDNPLNRRQGDVCIAGKGAVAFRDVGKGAIGRMPIT
jgi:hypothetical protein